MSFRRSPGSQVRGSDVDLLHAQGLALALVGGLLEGAGLIGEGEFGRLLGLLAAVTAETNDSQGDILAAWAGIASRRP